MALLVLFRNDPGFNSIQHHVVEHNSVSKVHRLLNSDDSEDLKMNRCQIVEQFVQLGVCLGVLYTLVDCDYELVGFIDCQVALGIDDSLHA